LASSAPTGHTETQLPQDSQLVRSQGISQFVDIRVSKPRWVRAMTLRPWSSPQARTQRRHMMQRSAWKVRKGLDESTRCPMKRPEGKSVRSMPYCSE